MTGKNAQTPPRVLIAEDHELVRYGLALTLEEQKSNGAPRVEIVGEAENGQEAVALAESEKPDIILMDIGMPVMDGITATARIKEAHPEIKVAMLTSHKDEEEIFASLAAGADAYCMKDIKVDRLCQVIEMVLDGALWIDPAIAQVVMKALPSQNRDPKEAAEPADGPGAEKAAPAQRKRYNTDLTEREMEVLELIVEGKSNKEIAAILHVTTHTAKVHVGNIIQKLAVDDRTQAAVKALQQGYVNTEAFS